MRQILRLADTKFQARVAAFLRDLNPWRRGIDADDAILDTDALRGERRQPTGAAADVEDPIAGPDSKQRDQHLAVRELRIAQLVVGGGHLDRTEFLFRHRRVLVGFRAGARRRAADRIVLPNPPTAAGGP